MPKHRYYHYDHEACAFVEIKPARTKTYLQVSALGVGALVLALMFSLGIDQFTETPEELALQAENEALQEQLLQAEDRIEDVAVQLDELAETDQGLYRVLLQADPISDDVRQAGVGGSDPYEGFQRFSTPTAALLRETSEKLDELERKLQMQTSSYRELSSIAEEHEQWLAQMPAILPTDGKVVSGFGMRNHPILKITRMHKGIDILVGTGTPVYATGDGVVKEAGRSAGYGLAVVIEHPEAGFRTRYAHLSVIPGHIRPGRSVTRGEQIALSGNTGLSKSPHLHYEVHDLDGQALNPIHFFAPSMTPQTYQALREAAEASTMSLD